MSLVINVRCTCEEEFLLLHKLHKLYQEDQLRQRLAKRMNALTVDGVQKEIIAVQGNGDGTESFTVKADSVELEENNDGWNGEDNNFCA